MIVSLFFKGLRCALCTYVREYLETSEGYKDTFKAYVCQDRVYINRRLAPKSCSVQELLLNYAGVESVDRAYSYNWREYISHDGSNIEVRSTRKSSGTLE